MIKGIGAQQVWRIVRCLMAQKRIRNECESASTNFNVIYSVWQISMRSLDWCKYIH